VLEGLGDVNLMRENHDKSQGNEETVEILREQNMKLTGEHVNSYSAFCRVKLSFAPHTTFRSSSM